MVRLSDLLFCVVTLAAHANAHALMTNPIPIGNVNNSPVKNTRNKDSDPSGGEYPCKNTGAGFFNNPTMNNAKPGDTMQVTFQGSAVHGGGSCQFSLTKDLAPNQNSIFKVIHSVEGGCPARNIAGNFPEDANFRNPNQYPVTIPKDLKPGRYTFAWSWINKVGNREFYMNCAAMQIGSGSGNTGPDSFFDSLPDMVVVNTNADTCERADPSPPQAFKFAFPGSSVERNEDLSAVNFDQAQCFAGGKKITLDPKTGAGSASSPTPVGPGAGSNTTTTTTAAGDDTPTVQPTGFASGKPSSLSTSTTTRTSQGANTPTPPSNPSKGNNAGIDTPPLNSTAISDCPNPCTQPGFECLASTSSYRNCAGVGDCAVIMPLAAGMTCDMFSANDGADDTTAPSQSDTDAVVDDARVKRNRVAHIHAHIRALRYRGRSGY